MADKVKKIFPRLIFLICVCLVVEILCNIKVMTLDKKESRRTYHNRGGIRKRRL